MEIKFRAWDGVKLSYGEREDFDDSIGFRFEHFAMNGFKPILEQFTGEKCYVTHSDLYVGDIMERNLELFVIEFKHGSFVCRSVDKPHKSYSLSIFTSVTSVGNAGAKIGNIHDNPELLEA